MEPRRLAMLLGMTPTEGRSRKQQRLDDHRHHAGWRDHGAHVHIVEVLQLHAVDRNHVAREFQLGLQQVPEGATNIALNHKEKNVA